MVSVTGALSWKSALTASMPPAGTVRPPGSATLLSATTSRVRPLTMPMLPAPAISAPSSRSVPPLSLSTPSSSTEPEIVPPLATLMLGAVIQPPLQSMLSAPMSPVVVSVPNTCNRPLTPSPALITVAMPPNEAFCVTTTERALTVTSPIESVPPGVGRKVSTPTGALPNTLALPESTMSPPLAIAALPLATRRAKLSLSRSRNSRVPPEVSATLPLAVLRTSANAMSLPKLVNETPLAALTSSL